MAEVEQTKVCPLCAETIKSAAKVCPYCRKVQNRLFFISQYDILALIAVLLLGALMACGFSLLGGGKQYSPTRDKISVLNSEFGVEITGDHTNAVVSGVLTNETDYSWNVSRLDVQFLDAAGKTTDADLVGHEYSYLTVLPHGVCSFHFNLNRKTVPEHSNTRLTVVEAVQPGLWFDNLP